jgi:hypothetical protein
VILPVRPRVLKRWLTLAGAILTAVVVTPAAKADGPQVYAEWKAPVICDWFALNETPAAVEPMFKAIMDDTGYSSADTARVLVEAVTSTCPRFLPVLRAYADQGQPAHGSDVWAI